MAGSGRRSSASAGTCSKGGAPSWIMYASIVIIAVVLLTLVYHWFVVKKMRQEAFEEVARPPFRMIYVHMDGCGYCERFMPVWMQLMEQHGINLKNKGISAEHYDRADAKWVELGIEVNGFPTVLMIDTQDNSKIGTFSSDRTVENLYSWAISTTRRN